jgi:MFS family permease
VPAPPNPRVGSRPRPAWRTPTVWRIALSAGFADLGYQSVLAGFPLFLVLALRQPAWEYGLASGLSYGGGAVFSLAGGRLGDRLGHRRGALVGNALLPLLSLCGRMANPAWAVGLLTGGWWARNFRSPSRRAMLVEAVPQAEERSAAFGFLHALDVGGGALAGVAVLGAVAAGLPYRWIFLATVVPLVASTLCLALVQDVGRRPLDPPRPAEPSADPSPGPPDRSPGEEATVPPGARALLAAAALYGFTLYSVGFPVLAVAGPRHRVVAGLGAFLVLQGVSSATGYLLGGRLGRTPAAQFARLGLLGYLLGGLGAGLVAGAAGARLGLGPLYLGVALIGLGLGVVETLEPTAMAVLTRAERTGRGMGTLSAARSVGTLVGNVMMGLLFAHGIDAAFAYAAAVGVLAGAVVLSAVPRLAAWERRQLRPAGPR